MSHPLSRALVEPNTSSPGNTIPPPLAVVGGVKPLFKGQTARPLRYTPVEKDFVIRNGGEFFNRPLYGRNNDFRVDAGDRPEFSVYLPGHGGNLKFGVSTASGMKWIANCDEVVTRYRPGRMIYIVKDGHLGRGSIRIEVLTAAAGALVKVESTASSNHVTLTWAFAGADGRKGSRNGDIGCESVPVSQYFQVKAEDCERNLYTMGTISPAPARTLPVSRLHSPAGDLLLAFPAGSVIGLAEFAAWTSLTPVSRPVTPDVSPHLPILTGSIDLQGSPMHFAIWRAGPSDNPGATDPATEFETRSAEIRALADTLQADTPDPYIDAAAAAFGPPANFLWDASAGCIMHGDVAWRARLAGWRGPTMPTHWVTTSAQEGRSVTGLQCRMSRL